MTEIYYAVNTKTRELKMFDSAVGLRLFLKKNNDWKFINIY
jgi:hypothetical protein